VRYARSWVFWFGFPLTLAFLVAGFAAAAMIILAAIDSLQYLPSFLSFFGAAIGSVFFFIPCYALWTLLYKSVRYVEVGEKTTITYIMGKKVSLEGVRSIYIRPNFRTVATLVIIDKKNGEIEINAPFEFKEPKRLFAALEIAHDTKVL
jgi:hypothetical protein